MKDETLCLHAGYSPKNSEPRVAPIVQSTTYTYDSIEEVGEVFDDPTKSIIYSRFANPTVMAVERKIADRSFKIKCTNVQHSTEPLMLFIHYWQTLFFNHSIIHSILNKSFRLSTFFCPNSFTNSFSNFIFNWLFF